MSALHRRLAALLALIALLAFVSGAGFAAPSVLPALVVLVFAVVLQPADSWPRLFEPLWRGAALLLAARAGLRIFLGYGDPVLPMVDLLLLLLCAESLRLRDGGGDARHFALTFALLIASAAYRPGPFFGVLFAAYVVVGTLVLVLGHMSREAREHERELPAPGRRFMLRVTLLSLVVLLISGAVFAAFPRVSHGWAARSSPPLSRAVVGFSDRVSLGQHGTRIESNPEVVLRVEFPGGPPRNVGSLHWRGRSYNQFDGVTWSRHDRPQAPPEPTARPGGGAPLEQVVYARPLPQANVLFGLPEVVEMTPLSRIRPVRVRGGDYLYTGDADPVYRVLSHLDVPAAAELRRVRRDYPPDIIFNLQIPALSHRFLALADSFRRAAPTVYDQVRAVEHYLRTQFTYTLDLPPTRREATLDHFVFERRAGHCEYFSTAMAMLLRAGGVPARNVNGFLGGDWNEFGRHLTITQNNAHSWVEVYFPGHGWLTFDPTPAAAAATIARGADAIGPLRRLMHGVEHRWGKWVLDYDLGRQSSLLERVSQPFSRRERRAAEGEGAGVLLLALVAAGVAGAVLLALRRRPRAVLPEVARSYVRLRQRYERLGFPPAHRMPPLAFAAALTGAPGAEHARRVVALYVAARFSGARLSVEEMAELRSAATAARRAVGRAARGYRITLPAGPSKQGSGGASRPPAS